MKPDISMIIEAAPLQIIWGGNYFSDVLPPTNDWLVWDKAQPDSVSFSGAEFAWSNVGRNARVKRHHWRREDKQHPTMKPVTIMEWCISFIPDTYTILDPFMGSGTTGVACANLGRRFIGVEIEPKYYDIARKRISEAYAQGRLFDEPAREAVTQGELL